MLKINLSDGLGDEEQDSGEETAVREPAETLEGTYEEEPEEPKKKSRNIQPPDKTRVLILLGLLAVATLFYFQKDMILGLFGGGEEPIPQVQAPPPPPPPPPPEEPPPEPDPTFVALNGISGVVPDRAWLSSVTISHDGSFDLKGISFSHAAMNTMTVSLETLGGIISKTIPPPSKSAEIVYNFSIQGKLRDIAVPEILDVIPTDTLVQLAETVKSKGADLGVTFTSLPQAGKTYTEKDLPFSLVGTFEGLKKTVALLCPDGGDVKVYRIVISPDAPGRSFDRVKAAFALRKTSSI